MRTAFRVVFGILSRSGVTRVRTGTHQHTGNTHCRWRATAGFCAAAVPALLSGPVAAQGFWGGVNDGISRSLEIFGRAESLNLQREQVELERRRLSMQEQQAAQAQHQADLEASAVSQRNAARADEFAVAKQMLELAHPRLKTDGARVRELAMFNLAIDSKLRGCDLVNLRVRDITHGSQILSRASVVQRKTQRPGQFELTEPTRTAVAAWIAKAGLKSEDYMFPSRLRRSHDVSTRQYARIVEQWVSAAGLDTSAYGTHSMRRTKATLIYKRTKNLRAVQLLLGHAKLESTVRYLGIEVEDALQISEQTEI